MPTGVALRDVREQLFAAAERVLLRDGPNALTSRAVTTEAGCAKGVLHKHFPDFDAFLAELVGDRIARVGAQSAALRDAAGTHTVAGNLTRALVELFDPVTRSIVGLVIFRDELRNRLRRTGSKGLPLLAEGTQMLAAYLSAEQAQGRVKPDTDVQTLALNLVGTAHLLFAGEEGAVPDAGAVHEVVAFTIVGAITE